MLEANEGKYLTFSIGTRPNRGLVVGGPYDVTPVPGLDICRDSEARKLRCRANSHVRLYLTGLWPSCYA